MNQKQFYKTTRWEQCRLEYIRSRIAIDGGMCEVCRNELGKIVHHVKWLNDENCNDPSIALNADNLRYECQTCHNREKDTEAMPNRRYGFTESGELIRKDSPILKNSNARW